MLISRLVREKHEYGLFVLPQGGCIRQRECIEFQDVRAACVNMSARSSVFRALLKSAFNIACLNALKPDAAGEPRP